MMHTVLENKVYTTINRKKDRQSLNLEFQEITVRIRQVKLKMKIYYNTKVFNNKLNLHRTKKIKQKYFHLI